MIKTLINYFFGKDIIIKPGKYCQCFLDLSLCFILNSVLRDKTKEFTKAESWIISVVHYIFHICSFKC